MKKTNILLVLGILIASCSNGGGDDSPVNPPKENQAPTKVTSLNYPTNNLLCITNSLEFKWGTSSDPDGDSVSYILEIAKDNQFSTIAKSTTASAPSKTVTLEKGIAYYWRVKAIDSKNLSSEYSEIFKFYTEGEGETNHLPFSPELVSPELDSDVSSTTINLQWNASDVDNDPLTYDIYFDTSNSPTTKIGDNISDKSLSVNLNTSTTYYWKVVVKDNNGGQSIGQTWSFTTN